MKNTRGKVNKASLLIDQLDISLDDITEIQKLLED